MGFFFTKKTQPPKFVKTGISLKRYILRWDADSISPYLFVLSAEFLAEAIRTNNNIEGITLYKQEHKISLHANDTSLFLKPTDPSACSGSSSAASACGTSSSTTSGDTIKEEYWRRAKTLMFIDIYEELMDQLENPQVSKSKVFEKICQRLATAGHVVTKQECMDKLRQLKYLFR